MQDMSLKDVLDYFNSTAFLPVIKDAYRNFKINYDNCATIIQKWDNNMLDTTPTHERHYYDERLMELRIYLVTIKDIAYKNGITL